MGVGTGVVAADTGVGGDITGAFLWSCFSGLSGLTGLTVLSALSFGLALKRQRIMIRNFHHNVIPQTKQRGIINKVKKNNKSLTLNFLKPFLFFLKKKNRKRYTIFLDLFSQVINFLNM